MNSLLVKLEDCQLNEILGGVAAKQVVKKAGAFTVKGTCSIVSGGIGLFLYFFASGVGHAKWCGKLNEALSKETNGMPNCLNEGVKFAISYSPALFLGVGGWKLGEWICKKIGLED